MRLYNWLKVSVFPINIYSEKVNIASGYKNMEQEKEMQEKLRSLLQNVAGCK